jgi:ATP-binding cassette subfamily B protein
MIIERDLRLRSHAGALGRFYLDALVGLAAIRAHGGERHIRREHAQVLGEWARAMTDLVRAVIRMEALQAITGFGLAAWLLVDHLSRAETTGGVLLLTYWALNIPVIAQEAALATWQYPPLRNITYRLAEPLGAPEQGGAGAWPAAGSQPASSTPVEIDLKAVTVQAAGHTILENITMKIEPGEHIAIVGPSGAGKSTLVGLLLGWHTPAKGDILINHTPLEHTLSDLRRRTAWIDPAVQIWNRSLIENITYGAETVDAAALPGAIEASDLRTVLERLPDGMETLLGEGGGFVSGGEGQRVRLARGLFRDDAVLAILDEPFRGLDRSRRTMLLDRARIHWSKATLLCITHDIQDTLTFPRVFVIENGRIVEDGDPAELAARPDGRFRAMLDAEQAARTAFWTGPYWKRMHLQGGQVTA